MRWKGNTVSVRVRWVFCVVALSVMAGVLVVGAPAQAVPGSGTVAGAPSLWCSDRSRIEGDKGPQYARAWVPAGATVSLYSYGEIEATFGSGQYRTQYNVHNAVYSPDGATLIDTDYWYFSPYAGNTNPGWVPFARRLINSWTNTTGVSDDFVIQTRGVPGLPNQNSRLRLLTDVEVTGGNGDPAPACPPDGLFDSEFFGPNAALRNQCPCMSEVADPVDTRTGNLHMPVPGLEVPGRGPGLAFNVGYNSLAAGTAGSTGFGWSNTLGMRLETPSAGVRRVVQETGATVRFASNGSGGWVAPDRFSAALVSNGNGTATFTRNHFEKFTFSESDGRLLSMADQFGNATTVHYPTGSTQSDYIEDSAGRRLNLSWSSGRIASVTDQMSGSGGPRSVSFGYDAAGDLTSYTDATGGVWTFTYDSSHRMLTMTKPRHFGTTKSIVNAYDWQGRVAWQEDELDRRTTIEYDQPAVGQTKITHPDSTVQVDRFVDGRREETTVGYGTADAVSTEYGYDAATLALTSVTDNSGKVTTFTNDAAGNRLSAKDPTGRVTRWTYNSFDQVTSTAVGETGSPLPASTANVVTSSQTYDGYGRLTQTKEAVGTSVEAATTYGYDTTHLEDLETVTDPRGKVWTFDYDADTGYLLTSADPLGNTSTRTYNNVGWLLTETSPKGTATTTAGDFQTIYAYNVSTRTTTVTGATGDVSKTVLDANGNVASEATGITGSNPTGDVTMYSYTDADETATIDPPGAGSKSYTYWPGGQRKRFTNENGGHWDYTYDAAGRLVTETDPLSKVTTYRYDTAGRLSTITQPGTGSTCTATPKVNCVTHSYDDAGRPTGIDYSDPLSPDVTGITYDALGRRTAATSNSVTETWGWDQRSRLTTTTDANGRTTGYGWDLASNLTSITYPGQTTPVVRAFDDAGRLTSVTDWASRATTFGYDANSNWTSTTFPSGTTNTDQYGYDDADRMTSAIWKQGSTTLGSESYTRPLKGVVDVTTRTGAAGSTATDYGYDARDRLTSASSVTYTYDPASNLTETADGRLQVFDASQQLCWSSPSATSGSCTTPASDATTYTYDDRGNRVSTAAPNRDVATHTYDQANRLTSVTSPAIGDGGGGQYHEITATRILDTRTSTLTGTCTPSPCATLTPGNAVDVSVGVTPIPTADVAAVAATVTIAGGGTGDGYARVNNSGTSAAATVNFTSTTTANRFVIAPVVNGKINLEIFGPSTLNGTAIVDVTGYYTTGDGSPGTTYHPTNPSQRLLDTRSTTRTGACPTTTNQCTTLTANTDKTVQASGRAGIPSSGVTAVVVNFTTANQTAAGLLRVAPGTTGGAGTINYTASGTVNDVIVVPLDANGRFVLRATTGLDVIADVAGYYTAPTATSAGSILSTVTPARIADTRSGSATGVCDGGTCTTLAANTQKTIKVRGLGNVADHATSAVVFITIAPGTTTGFVRVNPVGTGTGTSGTATINYAAGVRGSTVIAPIATDGTITVAATTIVDVIVDVTAYNAPPRWTYRYNSDGLRAAKIGPNKSIQYTWTAHGGLPLLLGEHTGTDNTWIIHGPGGQPIEQINPDGTPTWLHHDQLGSIRLGTNNTGNNVSARTWDAYGNPTTTSGSAKPILGYAGEYTDPETGYIYLRARYYDPLNGQFLTRDPLQSATAEPYGYAGSSPTQNRDPSGMYCVTGVAGHRSDGSEICRNARQAVNRVSELAYEHKGEIATVGAIVTCGIAGPYCAIATGVAFVARSADALEDADNPRDAVDDIAVDAFLTVTTFGLVSGAAAASRSAASLSVTSRTTYGAACGSRMTPAAPLARWQTAIERVSLAMPDIAGWVGTRVAVGTSEG